MLRIRRVDAVDDGLDVAPDDRKRRAQLVTDLCEQAPALRFIDLEACRHRVERADEIAQLARAAVDLGDAGGVVAGLNATGRLRRVQRRRDAQKPDPEEDGSPTSDQDDRHRRAGQVRQRARVGDEAEERADDP